MLNATDSFIQYLSTGLAGAPPVTWVRASTDDAATSELQMEALNVSILGYYEVGQLELPLISLDLLGTDERSVLRWTKSIRDLLNERQFIPEIDYDTNPLVPAPTGKCVYWDASLIDFKIIQSGERYVHINATFDLRHARQ